MKEKRAKRRKNAERESEKRPEGRKSEMIGVRAEDNVQTTHIRKHEETNMPLSLTPSPQVENILSRK